MTDAESVTYVFALEVATSVLVFIPLRSLGDSVMVSVASLIVKLPPVSL